MIHATLRTTFVLATLAACCAEPPFVGIPDAAHRSRDVALPLAADDREHLLDVLQVGSLPPRQFRRNAADPARVAVAAAYAAVLDQLGKPDLPKQEDLAAKGRIGALARSPELVIAVHDARAQELGLADARAIVVGDYVFAFYVARPVAVPQQGDGLAWRFDATPDGAYGAVTVCHRNCWHR